jgi:hypothetical protein
VRNAAAVVLVSGYAGGGSSGGYGRIGSAHRGSESGGMVRMGRMAEREKVVDDRRAYG